MLRDNTDKSWESYGKTDPYYGVLTSDKFRNKNLNDDAKAEFFRSGKKHIVELINRVEKKFGTLPRKRALDFGCGVGRLAFPLAVDIGFSEVVCMDISQSMLAEVRNNTDTLGINNLKLVISDDSLARLEGDYDFIHSFIVLQHIPVKRGEKIIRQLIDRLSPGGVAALQMPFARKVGLARKAANFIRVHVRPVHIVANILQSRPWRDQPIQMNRYNMNSILQIINECGIPDATIELSREVISEHTFLFKSHLET